MRVIVLGGGVIGLTSAYYLAKQGVKVTVIERQSGVALETSFANAGQISPGYSTPWAAPAIPAKAVKWLFQKHAPLAITPDGTGFQLSWTRQMLANCTARAYEINKERMMRVSEYSRDCLQALRKDTGIAYEERTSGTLQLFKKPEQLKAMHLDTKVLEECGVPYEVLDKEGVVRVEPALQYASAEFLGGLRLPNDETGDCHLFCQRLYEQCQRMGVLFCFNTLIDKMDTEQGRVRAVCMGDQEYVADAYVLAFGSYSRDLVKSLGLSLPVYPVKGYSLTASIVTKSAFVHCA